MNRSHLHSVRSSVFLFFSFIVTLFSPVNAYTTLSDSTLKSLPRPGNDFDIHDGALLAPILRTRVSGTPGSLAVLQHFVDFFENSLPDWHLEFQNSTSKTPVTGDRDVPFVNLIAIRDPPFATPGDVGRLTLAAHYDSKLEPEGFIGAIDSAAPCAMLLHSLRSIDAALTKKWEEMEADNSQDAGLDGHQGIQLFLLDGEEAFASWTATDSLYGARSLAETMETHFHPALSTYKNKLESIKLFVLLDLLGGKNPRIPSYFKTTHWAYKNMAKLEKRLRELGQFKSSPDSSKESGSKRKDGQKVEKPWFPDGSKPDDQYFHSGVSDDHVPFMQRGVDILHLIPNPFPRVWHDISDNAENLDPNSVEDWSILTTAFVAEWMDLEGHLDSSKAEQTRGEKGKSELT